jgi:hypothetical protein
MKTLLRACCLPILLAVGGCQTIQIDPVDGRDAEAMTLRAVQVQGCPTPETAAGARCLEAELLQVLAASGPAAAMEMLERAAERSAAVRREGHAFAHAIGLAAYDGTRDVSAVFSECTPAFQSGCYHGVIESYFAERIRQDGGQLSSEMVNALCRLQREDPEQRWLLFQCAHGMGHGMSMVSGYHLPTSLSGCDLVLDGWERESCYGGVFMENVVHATQPHHEIGRPEQSHGAAAGSGQGHAEGHAHHGAGAAGGHAHGGHAGVMIASAAEPFPPLKREDPLYPCNVLEARYLDACYQMQTSAILFFNGYDVAATARICAEAPEALRLACFQSLGRDVSSYTGQEHARAIRLCGTAPARYQPWCHVGYVKNLIDLSADPGDGIAYCRLLPEGESKRVCYVSVGEQAWVVAEDQQKREAACFEVAPPYREACRHGAGLPARASSGEPASAPGSE